MASALSALLSFVVFFLSFLAARHVVGMRGWRAALGLTVAWIALAAFFAYVLRIAPFAAFGELASLALAQLVLAGVALGLPAGLYKHWRLKTKRPASRD